jgi:hypothetical protein
MHHVSIFVLHQFLRCSVVNPFAPTDNDKIDVL